MKRKHQRGQELVEFALIVAIVLIFLFGIIDMGIAFLNHETIAQRAAFAARHYAVTGSQGEAVNIVMTGTPAGGSSAFTPLGLDGASVVADTISSTDPGSFTGPSVPFLHARVTITNYQYTMFTPFVGRLINTAPIVAYHPVER